MIIEMSKGKQVTIPAEVREEFNLHSGSKLELIKRKTEIVLRPIGEDLEAVFEEAKKIKPKHNLGVEEMEKLNEGLFR